VNTTDADGIIWTKEVEDYQRFGVVVTDEHEHMTRIVEKPREPISRRANIGLYYIRNWKLLYEGIAHTLAQPANKGEWYLTDAFQYMIDHGAKIKVVDVDGWYDAGQVETYLETNRAMLVKGRARRPATLGEGAEIVEPVYIEDDVTIEHATVGPNVSVLAGTRIAHATVSDTIIGAKSVLEHATLRDSLVGDRVQLSHVHGTVSVGDDSVVRGSVAL
jgi:glucose-1-phosphate thymidylyltransferase